MDDGWTPMRDEDGEVSCQRYGIWSKRKGTPKLSQHTECQLQVNCLELPNGKGGC